MTPAQPVTASPPGAWPMYRAMVGVGLMCGLMIVSVFEWTRPVIAHNRAVALQRAIFETLPAASTSRSFRRADDDRFVVAEGERVGGEQRIHAGYDETGRLVGLALEAGGMGYQDVIRILYGYSFEQQAIIGIRVLESKETPGLGDRIETDADFLENFKRLDVSLSADGTGLAHAIEAVKHGKKENPWEVDGITGATISSEAIARILDTSASSWVPTLQRSLDDFRVAE